jgi:hypothetical protein
MRPLKIRTTVKTAENLARKAKAATRLPLKPQARQQMINTSPR